MKRLLTWILEASFCQRYSSVPPLRLRDLPTSIPQKVSISSLLLGSTIYITDTGSRNWGHRDNYLYLGRETHGISFSCRKDPLVSLWSWLQTAFHFFGLELLGSSFWTRELGRNWNNIWVLMCGCVLFSRVSSAHWRQIVPPAYLEFSASQNWSFLHWLFFTAYKSYSRKNLEKILKDLSERHHTG